MLKQQLQTDVKEAMKQGNQDVLGVLRLALAAIAAKEKEKRYAASKEKPEATETELIEISALGDDEIIGVLSSEVKKRRDTITLYEQGNRPELAENEKKEIAVLQKYLPEQLSHEELKKLVQESITATGASSIKEMGKVMADLSPKIKGKAEGGEVSKIVRAHLENTPPAI